MRGRGIDFEHRFRTSRWAEDLLINALAKRVGLFTIRFGLSRISPDNSIVRDEDSDNKEPDLLVFSAESLLDQELAVLRKLDLENLDRAKLRDAEHRFILKKALAALEVEFSPYKAKEMAGRNWQPKTVEEWNRRPLKHAKPPIAPNIFIKEEDLPGLSGWEKEFHVPIFVVHIFDQEGFAIALRDVIQFNKRFETARTENDRKKLQVTTGIFKLNQPYDRVDAQGAREQKIVFRISPAAAVKVGDLTDVDVSAQVGLSASKKYVSHVLFTGGRIQLREQFLDVLRQTRD